MDHLDVKDVLQLLHVGILLVLVVIFPGVGDGSLPVGIYFRICTPGGDRLIVRDVPRLFSLSILWVHVVVVLVDSQLHLLWLGLTLSLH